MDVSEATRLKSLEEENSRLKCLAADQALDIQILKEVTQKVVSPVRQKTVIETLVSTGSCGVAWAYRLFGLARSAVFRRAMPDAAKLAQEGLVVETSRAHPSLGYRKVTAILRDGHGETISEKRVARLHRRHGLQASSKQTKRRRIKPLVTSRRVAKRRDEVWSYDFIQDSLADGTTVRILSVIDEYSRECVMLRSAGNFPSHWVIDCP